MINIERQILYPAIYRHYTQKFYATMGISNPQNSCFLEDISKRDDCLMLQCCYTEDSIPMIVYKLNGSYYHNRSRNRALILYKTMYDDSGMKARDLDIFAEELDKNIFPQVNQPHRYELVRIF